MKLDIRDLLEKADTELIVLSQRVDDVCSKFRNRDDFDMRTSLLTEKFTDFLTIHQSLNFHISSESEVSDETLNIMFENIEDITDNILMMASVLELEIGELAVI